MVPIPPQLIGLLMNMLGSGGLSGAAAGASSATAATAAAATTGAAGAVGGAAPAVTTMATEANNFGADTPGPVIPKGIQEPLQKPVVATPDSDPGIAGGKTNPLSGMVSQIKGMMPAMPKEYMEQAMSTFIMKNEEKSRTRNLSKYVANQIKTGNSDFKFKNSANTDENNFGDFDANNILGGNSQTSQGFEEAGMRFEKGGTVNNGFIEADLTDAEIEELQAKGIEIEFL